MLRCVVCGGMVTERDDLTADGLRCAGCSMRAEIATHEQNIVDEVHRKKQRNLYWRAVWIGWAHALMWMLGVLFFCGGRDGAHRSWFLPLFIVVIGGRVALSIRQRWALYVALSLDGIMIVAPFVAALVEPSTEMFIGAAVIAFFPLVFGLLLYSLRHAYDPKSKGAPVAAEAPKKWSAPGRQF